MWTSVEVSNIFMCNEGYYFDRWRLVNKLSVYFGPSLIVLSSPRIASLLVFRKRASEILKLKDDENDDVSSTNVEKHINNETKASLFDKEQYPTVTDKIKAVADVSSTFLSLMSQLSSELDSTLPALLIGNMLASILQKRATTLQIALAVMIRDSKILVSTMHHFVVTCTYDDILRFKRSAKTSIAQSKNN